MRGPCCDGKVLYLDCVHFSTLVGILYYSFIRYCHWGKWVQGTRDFSVLILICEFVISVHGIFQERILEWVAIPFNKGSS